MAATEPTKAIRAYLRKMTKHLETATANADAMAGSSIDAGAAQSIEDISLGAAIALKNIDVLVTSVKAGYRDDAVERVTEMKDHITLHIARPAIVEDLHAVIADAEAEAPTRVGKHRKPYRDFIKAGEGILKSIEALTNLSADVLDATEVWAAETSEEEAEMAENDANTGVEDALRGIGRQLSFLSSNQSIRASGGTEGSGRFRSVADQIAASLDSLGLPHNGIQFASGTQLDSAREDLIEGLLDNFRPVERGGVTEFIEGRTDGRRAPTAMPDHLLGGAAKSAARLVRAEGDNILDILDRLPDMTRFQTKRGIGSPRQLRDVVADRVDELYETMTDPLGVNVARAIYDLRRAMQAVLDFFDYANLETEFLDAIGAAGIGGVFFREPEPEDEDETGKRRTILASEEIRYEIAEIANSSARLRQHILAPLSNQRGTNAARLEQSITAAAHSALDLRSILVQSGSNLPEQDLHFFNHEVLVVYPSQRFATGRGILTVVTAENIPYEISLGQLLDWIVEVAEPHLDARHAVAGLQVRDLEILADELQSQDAALTRMIDAARDFDFAIRLPGPMRQLEELQFHISTAAGRAGLLVSTEAA